MLYVGIVAQPVDRDSIKPPEDFNWEKADEIPYRPFHEGPYFLNMGNFTGFLPSILVFTKPKSPKQA